MVEAAPIASDAIEAELHPRLTSKLIGQYQAQAQFFEAMALGKVHHGWLISGPKGVGKATLAWKMAGYLLAHGGAGNGKFDLDPNATTARQIAALSHPQLYLLRRSYDEKSGRLAQNILVDDVRAMRQFFQLSAPEAGYRVVIIDSIDEMNMAASNALLKILEEPPQKAVLLLISHQPSGILATLRSRCRRLTLGALSDQEVLDILQMQGIEAEDPSLTVELSAGSVGEAVRLIKAQGLDLYRSIETLLAQAPQLNRGSALELAQMLSHRTAQAQRELFCEMLEKWLYVTLKSDAMSLQGGKNASMFSPNETALALFAQESTKILRRLRDGLAVNLDAEALILDTLMQLAQLAHFKK